MPTLSETSSFPSTHTASDATAVSPYLPLDWERTTYYNGISLDHPELLYRSDLLENSFPIPKGRHSHLPTKIVYGVFNTSLNGVWDIVTPQICEFLKVRKIRYLAIKATCFVTHGEDGKDTSTVGPVVIWIATHPTTTTAENAHDASPGILALLKDNGVEGAVVEWYEGAVEKLSGPCLLRATDDTNPTHYVRRFLTAALGMPIATAEREATDGQGSVTMSFYENNDKRGASSVKAFSDSNCHVLRKDTTVEYEFKGAGALVQHVRLAGFQRGLDEIKACVSGYGTAADHLAREIVELEVKLKSEEVAEDEAAMVAKRKKLAQVMYDLGVLETFYYWSDIMYQNIGPCRLGSRDLRRRPGSQLHQGHWYVRG